MTVESIFFALLRKAICQEKLNDSVAAACTPEALEEVYTLALKHDLAHLVGYALKNLEMPDSDASAKLKKAQMMAIYRYARLDYEYERICDLLEAEGIPFIPLKGSVLRTYYPESWMRTSCDIDILVKEEMLDAAVSVLEERLKFTNEGKNDHDISLFSESGVHLELHYLAIDRKQFPEAQAVMATIWKHAENKEEKKYHKVLSDEMFYFYHIIHMAKHVANGGCGVRPFLDLWIMNHQCEHDCSRRVALLRTGKLLKFSSVAEKLSEIWFSGAATDAMSQKLERYILDGGTYGCWKNQVRVKHTRMGGRTRYLLYKIFLPYEQLKCHYPILQKYKLLVPVFEVRRWFRLLFFGGMKRSVNEMLESAEKTDEENVVSDDFLKYLGFVE